MIICPLSPFTNSFALPQFLRPVSNIHRQILICILSSPVIKIRRISHLWQHVRKGCTLTRRELDQIPTHTLWLLWIPLRGSLAGELAVSFNFIALVAGHKTYCLVGNISCWTINVSVLRRPKSGTCSNCKGKKNTSSLSAQSISGITLLSSVFRGGRDTVLYIRYCGLHEFRE